MRSRPVRGGRLGRAFFGLLAAALMFVAAPAVADERLPIFDTHAHYSEPAWSVYRPDQIIDKLKGAGVIRAMVSSTPDDGTLTLYKADPGRIVPVLRPYRDGADMHDWYASAEVMFYLANRLQAGRYAGIGEFHLLDASHVRAPEMRRLVRLATSRDVALHVHSGAEPVRALFALEPMLRILWAHAGMSEPPGVVGAMLDSYPRLLTEIALRGYDIAPGGTLDSAWRELLVRHRDRIMIGSDTWVTSRWDVYGEVIDEHRNWLNQLPRDVAEAIAYKNAMREFGESPPGQ